jgi:hypothetical protein
MIGKTSRSTVMGVQSSGKNETNALCGSDSKYNIKALPCNPFFFYLNRWENGTYYSTFAVIDARL